MCSCFSSYFCHWFSSFPEFFSPQSSFSFSAFFFCPSHLFCTFSSRTWRIRTGNPHHSCYTSSYMKWSFPYTLIWSSVDVVEQTLLFLCFLSQLMLSVFLTFKIKFVWFLTWSHPQKLRDSDGCKELEENSRLGDGGKAPLLLFCCPVLEIRVQPRT